MFFFHVSGNSPSRNEVSKIYFVETVIDWPLISIIFTDLMSQP